MAWSSRFALALLAVGALQPSATWAAPLCPGLEGVRASPPELAEKIGTAFRVSPEAARNSMIRCEGPKLLACIAGANLNCGRADARRVLPGAADYCRGNPNSSFIPMFATGHATIYAWSCSGGRPVPGKAVLAVDPLGYAAENWKEIRGAGAGM